MRQEIAVSADDVERHALNLHPQEPIGPDVPHLPKLGLTRPNRVRRRYGTVDRDQFLIVRPANWMVLKQNDSLSEISKERIEAFATFNDDTTRHAANDLRVYIPVHVWMKPE